MANSMKNLNHIWKLKEGTTCILTRKVFALH